MSKGNSAKDQQMALATRQQDLADHEAANADQLRGIVLPGLQKSEDYYSKLASGDPMEIFRQIAPATEQIGTQTQAVKDRITNETQRGGEQRLAKEMADINAAGQVGNLATKSYTSAFPALSQLAGQGLGLSINEIANAISSNSGASNTYGSVAQADSQGKASTMGFLGSLAGAGGGMAAAAMG